MKSNQEGLAFIIMMFLLFMGAVSLMFQYMDSDRVKIERNKKTVSALAEAKTALIGYAVKSGSSMSLTLPCPDTNNDGLGELSCNTDVGGIGQIKIVGRLPWKTLGLEDLRDGYGERLWFVVSSNLVNLSEVPLIDETLINSSNPTYPWLEVYDVPGNPITKKAVALIISPGSLTASQSRFEVAKFTSGLVVDPVSQSTISNDQIIFTSTDELNIFLHKLKGVS